MGTQIFTGLDKKKYKKKCVDFFDNFKINLFFNFIFSRAVFSVAILASGELQALELLWWE